MCAKFYSIFFVDTQVLLVLHLIFYFSIFIKIMDSQELDQPVVGGDYLFSTADPDFM